MALKLKINPDYEKIEKYFSTSGLDPSLVKFVLSLYERDKDIKTEKLIISWNNHVDVYLHRIKQLLDEYDLPLSHSDNLCCVSILMSFKSDKSLDKIQSQELTKIRQLELLEKALNNEKVVGIKILFPTREVPISEKSLLETFTDDMREYILLLRKVKIMNLKLPKKTRKSSIAYQINIERSLTLYLMGENLFKIKHSSKNNKSTAYEFIYDFLKAIDRPLMYSEGESAGNEVPRSQAQDYLKEKLR